MEIMVDKNVLVRDSVFDPNALGQKTVHYSKVADNKARYKVWVYLEGKDLYYVDYVAYKLHPTFQNPVQKVKRTLSNPNCSLVIWTWGVFNLEVELFLKTGEKIVTTHYLSYDRQLKKEGIKFIEEKD